jgi:hypothetical protein
MFGLLGSWRTCGFTLKKHLPATFFYKVRDKYHHTTSPSHFTNLFAVMRLVSENITYFFLLALAEQITWYEFPVQYPILNQK